MALLFLAADFPPPFPPMLNTKQLQALRKLVSADPKTGEKGRLCGKGYREIAEEFGKDQGISVTEGSIRHYLRNWLRESGSHVVPPPHGWRKGKKRKQGRARKPLPWAFLYRELLALTGWPVSQLHAELKSAGFEALPARRTLLEQTGRSGTLEALPSMRHYGRVKLTDRFIVRIHQVALTRVPGKSYWIVMAAYEVVTGFLNVTILDLNVPDDQPRRRGRPKVMDVDEPVGVVDQKEGGDFVHLHQNLWWQFCAETIDRLGLPVGRFEYVSNLGLEPLQLEYQGAQISLASACKAGANVASHLLSEEVFKQLAAKLTSIVRRHNQKRKAVIDQQREEVVRRFNEAREKGEPGIRSNSPPFEEAERYALLKYYRGIDSVKQLQLKRLAYRPEKGRITLRRHDEQTTTSDVVPLPAET